jgi:hypothetical protein
MTDTLTIYRFICRVEMSDLVSAWWLMVAACREGERACVRL